MWGGVGAGLGWELELGAVGFHKSTKELRGAIPYWGPVTTGVGGTMGIMQVYRAAATASFVLCNASAPALGQATVRGILYDDASGRPVRGTVMLIDPATDAAVVHGFTDSLGQFALSSRIGTFRIGAVSPGFTSVLSADVPLADGERLTVQVPIAQAGDPQHRIAVVEHIRPDQTARPVADRMDRVAPGFSRRRALGAGAHYDRSQLASSNAATLGEFLQSVPGFSVRNPGSTASMQMSRSAGMPLGLMRGPAGAGCHVGWFVDGHRMDLRTGIDPATDGLGSMQLDAVEALEVFRGLSEMPPELADPDLRCGAVSIWTRRG